MSATHTTSSTPNPRDRSLIVTVGETTYASNPFCLPKEGTLYKDFPKGIKSDDYLKQFAEYVYVCQIPTHKLLFAPNKTPQEANTPYRSVFSKFGNHRWHPILKNLVLLENPSFPRATNFILNGEQGFANAPSYDDQYIYIPDVNEGSRFLTQEYFSPRPFVIPSYRVPIPTGIQYSLGDLKGSFQDCLHDDIEIPAARQSNAIFLGSTALSGSGSQSGQFFPKTNFQTWLPYVVYDEQELQVEGGGWYRKRIRVYPPLRPRAIRRA